MVMMGINRIVVTSGRIRAKMGFHIDAHDTGPAHTASEFDEKNDDGRRAAGSASAARRPSTASRTSARPRRTRSDELNVDADLTGEVDLRFKSDYLPLERMATPQMIGAIQGNTPNPAANTPQTGGTTTQPQPAHA